ncbi:MAG: hypothetical protein LBU14_03710 [Candidatus Peribacteria bacterium]|nr:hypothetical protein [Candidatus Peribacteria bacterium]
MLSSINSRLESKFSDVANHVAEKFVPLSESAKQVDDALKGLRDPATSAIQAFEYMGILARAGRQKAALEALNKNEKLKNEMHLKDKLEREGFANFENGNWTQTAEQIEKTKSIKPSTNTTGNGGSGNGLTDEDARDQKVKISNGEKIFDVGVSVNMNKNSKTAEKLIIKSDDVTIEQL